MEGNWDVSGASSFTEWPIDGARRSVRTRPSICVAVPVSAYMFGAYREAMNAQLKIAGQSPELLGLGSILVGSLPATLLTDDAPDRYTVEAVFTRKVDRDEVAAIEGGETRAHLSAKGYSTVELRVADRRLEIANTHLEELRDGLAAVLADRLAEISAALVAEREIAAHRFQDASDREQVRAASVAALAESVAFIRPDMRIDFDDGARIEDWVEEGGSVRD